MSSRTSDPAAASSPAAGLVLDGALPPLAPRASRTRKPASCSERTASRRARPRTSGTGCTTRGAGGGAADRQRCDEGLRPIVAHDRLRVGGRNLGSARDLGRSRRERSGLGDLIARRIALGGNDTRRELAAVERCVARGDRRLQNRLRHRRRRFGGEDRALRRGELHHDHVLRIVAGKEADEVGVVAARHVPALHRPRGVPVLPANR